MFSQLESTERPKSRMQLPSPRINKHQETAEFQRSDSNLEGLLAELHATFSGSSELSVGERVLVGGWGDLLKVTGVWWWR